MKKFNQFISEASYSHAPGDKPHTFTGGYSYLRDYVEGGSQLESKLGDDEFREHGWKWSTAYAKKNGADVIAWNDIVKQGRKTYTVTRVDTGETFQAVTLGKIAYIKRKGNIVWGRAASLRKKDKSEFVR